MDQRESQTPESLDKQAAYFANRLAKRYAHLKKWARRREIECYRLYDNDIPEVPLAVDLYADSLVMALYERPYDKPEDEEAAWLSRMASTAAQTLSLPLERVYVKQRRRQRGTEQYESLGASGAEKVVCEGGLSFWVNLSDYLDTGLFLDQRLTREWVRERSAGKRVLNLFCYTGSFSVYAAAGKAREVVSVDLSNTYLDWAARNMKLNGFGGNSEGPSITWARADVLAWLSEAKRKAERFDLIVLDPPTFSNSKKMLGDFDLNRDHPELIRACLALLNPGGTLMFSTNSRKLKFTPDLYPAYAVREVTEATLDEDFRDRRLHRAWTLEKQA
jgi:23S rRNA G2069 N7-methylase RlmK/C1962 C5-methylase RlmI